MSKQLATAVHLTDEEGVVHSFLQGTNPPKWARDRIDNPKAWTEDATAVEDTATDQKRAARQSPTVDVIIPAKNAKTETWRAYADHKGFETDDDISRAEIIAALTAAGIATE